MNNRMSAYSVAVSLTRSPLRVTRRVAKSTTSSPARNTGFSRWPVSARRSADPQPGQEFARAEGLHDVIIRTAVQRLDFVGFLVEHREHHDGSLRPFADLFEHGDAFHVRQAEVEDDDVVTTSGSDGERLLAGAGRGDAVAIGFERDRKQPLHLQLVVNHQHRAAAIGFSYFHKGSLRKSGPESVSCKIKGSITL